MIDGIEIIDAHMHLLTEKISKRRQARLESRSEEYRRALQKWRDWFVRKYNSDLGEDNPDPPEKIARDWQAELDRHGVDRAFFITLSDGQEELTSFLDANRERFFGFAAVDPYDPEAPLKLRQKVRKESYRGLKFYPLSQHFLPSERSMYPIYEEARSLGIPIMFHFGILLSYDADLRYGHPEQLHPVAKDFPDLEFIIAHFGAGYFQEVLFLAYHVQNVSVDTSGTNRWIEYLPYRLELREVFQKSLDILGPERIIFGTDSRMLGRGYRRAILNEQIKILSDLNLSREETALIMGGNIRRLTGT
jgi:predicted TIM-barrel fold metal-dependent hydrolase